MKDKRQRMAFTWPYGDPQMLAYMISAVAASSYGGGNPNSNMPLTNMPNMTTGQMQPNAIGYNNQQQLQMNSTFQPHSHQTKHDFFSETAIPQIPYSTVPGNIPSEMQVPLHLSIKTPSPDSSVSESASYSSSSSSFSASHHMTLNSAMSQNQQQPNHLLQHSTPFQAFSNLASNSSSELISPISLFIPNATKPQTYSNYDAQVNLLLKPNIHGKNMPVGTNTSQNVTSLSFKSPAFGLGDCVNQEPINENQSIHHQTLHNSNIVPMQANIASPLDSDYSSYLQSAQRSF